MRFLLVCLFVGLCAASAIQRVHDTGFNAQRQKDIFRLFKYINQPSYYQDHQEIAKNYRFFENHQQYEKPEIVQELYNYYRYGKLLQRGEIFSVFNREHLKQAILLFKLFYYANSYETFYYTAAWARNNINEGMFIYSFSVAVVHRPDTYMYSLPPIFEIYPYYFYNSEVIQKAQIYKQIYQSGQHEAVIYANYSGDYLNLNPEQSMSYFTEDVGVNSYYYYYSIYYPYWMSGEEFKLKNDKRGEVFYYMYQQILARYYLERLSNGFGEIPEFNWEVPMETGYYSSLTYPNGLQFPSRPAYANLHEYFYNYGQKQVASKYTHSYTKVLDYERRIRDAINMGYVHTPSGQKVDLFTNEGFNTLGNLIESNPDSPYYRYYGAYQTFARHLLGYAYQPLNYHQTQPSTLEHFETSMRDPAFYQLYKKLIQYFIQFKSDYYKYYTEQDLMFPGVTVRNVEFDRLTTFFDYFYSDISNAIYVTPEEFVQDSFKVKVVQERLNYKPFTYKVHVNAEQATDAVVRVYMGPKYDEYGRYINLTENWMNFVQFDHFVYKLQPGENVITRNSDQIYNYMHDRTSYKNSDEQNYYKNTQFWFGFPQRFMLPKGSEGGVRYQFYVIVSKQVPYKYRQADAPMVGTGSQYVDGYPLGYPFDRPVYFEQVYYDIPNSYVYEAKVYHKEVGQEYYAQQSDSNQGYYHTQKQQEQQQYYDQDTEEQQQPKYSQQSFLDKSTYGPKYFQFQKQLSYGQQPYYAKNNYGQTYVPQKYGQQSFYGKTTYDVPQKYAQQSFYDGQDSYTGQQTPFGQNTKTRQQSFYGQKHPFQLSYKQQDFIDSF